MSDQPQVLVIGEPSVGRKLSAELGENRGHPCADPYEALLEMARRPWEAVILAAPDSELAGLARASRRLAKQARIVALCSPADEHEVLPLAGGVLDDYLIYPPSSSELAAIVGETRAAPVEPQPPAAPAPGGLSADEYAQLVQSTGSLWALELAVTRLVGQRIGLPVQWIDSGASSSVEGEVLLRAPEPPRALVATDSSRPIDPAGRAVLAQLQQSLPALQAVARRTQSLHRMASTDYLTGAYNRRYFFHLTDKILQRAQQKYSRITMLLYDIDDFKKYNDTYGHAAGDDILRQTAALMRRITRSQDVVARVGGEEFAVLFWDAEPPRSPDSKPPESPYVLADRFRRAVSDLQFPSLGPKARGVLTVSGGLASFPRDGRTCEELLAAADSAMLEAKRAGKNRIRIVGPE
ncbi:MAG TPA: GGDEF domain-containing protein [Phycisphaerae bacterium]|nr:GGDEF domain-containing protein [Phycisphaerae bacterium]